MRKLFMMLLADGVNMKIYTDSQITIKFVDDQDQHLKQNYHV
jgi:hypothetical protein